MVPCLPTPPQIPLYSRCISCYAYKFGIVTNVLGIVRDISFYNKEFLAAHPDIVVEKTSDSLDEDKSLADSKALIPVLKVFFLNHPLINPKVFPGDVAFDSALIYKYLLLEAPFERAYIPLNGRISLEDSDCPLNEERIPCCPKDPTLPMRRERSRWHLRCGLPTMKFVCPKMKWRYDRFTKNPNGSVNAKPHVQILPAGACSISTPRRTLGLIPALPVAHGNGIPHTISG